MSVATQLEDLEELDHFANRQGPHEWMMTTEKLGITGLPGRPGSYYIHLDQGTIIRLVVCRCRIMKFHYGEYYNNIQKIENDPQ